MRALQISRKIDYALRALAYLAGRHGTEGCTLGEIAARTAVSSQFLAKIIEQLAQRGLVRSRRGPRGGYVLARQPNEVTVNDVIEAIEGPIVINTCTRDHDTCALLPNCEMTPVWQEAERQLIDVFTRTTLADVKMEPCRGGDTPRVGDPGADEATGANGGNRSPDGISTGSGGEANHFFGN